MAYTVTLSLRALKLKHDPFSVALRWNAETNRWVVEIQREERGDVEVLGHGKSLNDALKSALSWPNKKAT